MNRRIQLRRDPEDSTKPIALFEGVGRRADLDNFTPKRHLTRVWMGVVPPDGEDPGYAAVLGEVNDPSQLKDERVVYLLDEGVALDPDDFNEAERDYYGIREDNKRKPTKRRLAQAVVALKDLYWPQKCILPPASSVGSDGQLRGDQPAAPWTEFIRGTDGMVAYSSTFGGNARLRRHPFFRSAKVTIGAVLEAHREDLGYNLALIEAMYDADLLKIYDHCSIYLDERPATSRRCVGLILSEMELLPVHYMQVPVEERTGYAEPSDDEDALAELEAEEAESRGMRNWWSGRPEESSGGQDRDNVFGRELIR